MRLYHGSNTNIVSIQLSLCRPYKDFGRGFYLTDIYEQALNMAKRVARLYGGKPVVNVYQIDDRFESLSNLNIKIFDLSPSEEWAVFVMNNRNRSFRPLTDPLSNQDNKYDIIIGPVANDDISFLFRQYIDHAITHIQLVESLAYKKLFSQYSFHTEIAVALLKKEDVVYE